MLKNDIAVLKYIQDNPQTCRADIVTDTSMPRSDVGASVARLFGRRLIDEPMLSTQRVGELTITPAGDEYIKSYVPVDEPKWYTKTWLIIAGLAAFIIFAMLVIR